MIRITLIAVALLTACDGMALGNPFGGGLLEKNTGGLLKTHKALRNFDDYRRAKMHGHRIAGINYSKLYISNATGRTIRVWAHYEPMPDKAGSGGGYTSGLSQSLITKGPWTLQPNQRVHVADTKAGFFYVSAESSDATWGGPKVIGTRRYHKVAFNAPVTFTFHINGNGTAKTGNGPPEHYSGSMQYLQSNKLADKNKLQQEQMRRQHQQFMTQWNHMQAQQHQVEQRMMWNSLNQVNQAMQQNQHRLQQR